MPNFSLLQNETEIAAIRNDWRALAEAEGNLFVTPEWRDAAIAHYNPNDLHFVATGRDSTGNLIAAAPLMLQKTLGIPMIRFPGFQLGDIFAPATIPDLDRIETALALVAAIEDVFPRKVAMLDNLCSRWIGPLAAAPRWAKRANVRYSSAPLPRVEFGDGGWDEYLASRSRNFRSQIGRRSRNLERDHDVRFRLTTDPETLTTDLDTVLDLHVRRWDERGGSGSITDTSRRFHHQVATAALERGWLRLWILEVDGRPAAGWYGWRLGDTYSYYLSGFDPAFGDDAVATILLAHTIEAAANEGAAVYDLLLGDEEYKNRFATSERKVETLALPPRHSFAAALMHSEAAARRLIRATPEPVKRVPMKLLGGVKRRLPTGAPR